MYRGSITWIIPMIRMLLCTLDAEIVDDQSRDKKIYVNKRC